MPERFKIFLGELKKPPNLAIAILTIIFIAIWSSNWQYNSDVSWWFDTLGHAVAGFGGALALRYLIRRYAARGFFVFDDGRKFLATVVEAWVMKFAVFWEALEFIWDVWGQPYLLWLARAQKDLFDTMVDILVAVLAARFALMIARWFDDWYERHHPEDTSEEEFDEVMEIIRRLSRSKNSRRRSMRKKRIERVIGFLKEELDKIGDKFKDDEN